MQSLRQNIRRRCHHRRHKLAQPVCGYKEHLCGHKEPQCQLRAASVGGLSLQVGRLLDFTGRTQEQFESFNAADHLIG